MMKENFKIGNLLMSILSFRRIQMKVIATIIVCVFIFITMITTIGNTVSSSPEMSIDSAKVMLFAVIFLSFLFFGVFSLIRLALKENLTQEWLTAILVLVIGLFYMFAMTPLAIPDEPHHYHSAYEVANHILMQDNHALGDSEDFDYTDFQGHYNTSSGYLRIMSDMDAHREGSDHVPIPFPHDASYFIQYLPQGLGLAIGRILNLNMVPMFYLGRLANLIFYTICVYFAVKYASRFRVLFSLAALMPMALHQAASYSYDAFVNGISILLIAMLIRSIYGDGILPRKEFFLITILGILISPAKLVYWFILMLAFLIPNERFGSKKNKYIGVGIILLTGGLLIVVFRIQDILKACSVAEQPKLNWEGEKNYSIDFVLSHPVETLKIFIRTIEQCFNFWWQCAIGYSFAGLTLLVSNVLPRSYALLFLLFALFCEDSNQGEVHKIYWYQRLFYCIVFLVAASAIMMYMLLSWTSDIRNSIQGVQGRYFIPIILLPTIAVSFPLFRIRDTIIRSYVVKSGIVAAVLVNVIVLIQVMSYTVQF